MKSKYAFLLLALVAVFFISCEKEMVEPCGCGGNPTTGTGTGNNNPVNFSGICYVTMKPGQFNAQQAQATGYGPAVYIEDYYGNPLPTAYCTPDVVGNDINQRIINYFNRWGYGPQVGVENGWVTSVND